MMPMRAAFFALICCVLTACGQAGNPDEAAITTFLNRYFSTWSARDMEGYGSCFSPLARITYAGQGGQLQSDGFTDFIHGQTMSHAAAGENRMTEVPTGMKISGDARVAQAAVRWRLTQGARITTGTDFFTLVKTPDGWRIMSLVFYND